MLNQPLHLAQILMDEPHYEKYGCELAQFLREASEDNLLTFLRALHPGSVQGSLGLLLIYRVVSQIPVPGFNLIEIEEVLRSRIPQDPFAAYWAGCLDLR